jgi:hypothetical protein
MCADAGLSIDQTAKALHVTPRTVRYWISGRVSIPYAATAWCASWGAVPRIGGAAQLRRLVEQLGLSHACKAIDVHQATTRR